MTYIYRMAGENMDLAASELQGFLESMGVEEEPDIRQPLCITENHPGQLKRLALVHEVSELLSRSKDVEYRPANSFAVRAEDFTGEKSTKQVEKELGERLSTDQNSVDLENPEEVINAYIFEDEILVARQVVKIERGLYRQRKNQRRPFSSPVSLDPVLARVMVNLSGVSAGEKLLDPFCGTGGILLEAGLCGIDIYGTDIQQKMVEGARENLENYGVLRHSISKLDVEDLENFFDFRFDAVVTDLPYGKASKKAGQPVKLFLDSLENITAEGGKAVFMSNRSEIEGMEPEFEVYVHKNLTRHIYVKQF